MRGIDLFCASQASTSVHLTSMDHNASSSSSSVHLGSSRLIDRHNPIINDPSRVQGQPRASEESDLLVTPQDILDPKVADLASRVIKSPPSVPKPAFENDKAKKSKKKKNKESGNSDFVSKISCAKGGGFVSPFASTRFLLGDQTSLLDIVPDCEQVVSVVPAKTIENKVNSKIEKKLEEEGSSVSYRGSSSHSSEQVVVLRVSLHCKGCAGKVKKHISRMQGVTSFNIDFAAKKVTVVGDVTPVEVLASISKVKTAKLWTPPKPPSTTYSEINKSKTVV